ncbi:hypothetical protein [Ornithinimicrobium sp. INDO-MA30-4]|uniref:hypothetical protein n=1 Tax=Ornithinimicrobium sp. INDO-MA30-4 TaxID=2908651 RepID=UPI001F251177|nr:hypothetical protein [Ornithinimicrobium sp. INDO-MA30-4]UJH71709.1 hypothetical protein L0A91_01440 [Ornithinimicrobium sp. INDO-MA30-4]
MAEGAYRLENLDAPAHHQPSPCQGDGAPDASPVTGAYGNEVVTEQRPRLVPQRKDQQN